MFVGITIFFYVCSVFVSLWAVIVVLSFIVTAVGEPLKMFWRYVSLLR